MVLLKRLASSRNAEKRCLVAGLSFMYEYLNSTTSGRCFFYVGGSFLSLERSGVTRFHAMAWGLVPIILIFVLLGCTAV